MNKIFTIIRREYLSRVKKKSFLIMTILGPILMAGLMVAPALLNDSGDEEKKIIVVDHSHIFEKQFEKSKSIEYTILDDITAAKALLIDSDYNALVEIPPLGENTGLKKIEKGVTVFAPKQVPLSTLSAIETILEKEIERKKMKAHGIDPEIIKQTYADIDLTTIQYKGDGKEEESSTTGSMIIGMIAGMLIYFFIFMYGTQVMRGVIEEKSNRIVEVIISSVKPFELMMGKIVGIALVGLTQFLLWVLLTSAILTIVSVFIGQPEMTAQQAEAMKQVDPDFLTELMQKLSQYDFAYLIGVFLFFFMGGYLLYGSLFAAIGAAVDQETDSQQFIIPITIPLIFSFVVAQSIIENPDGNMAFWFSIFPLTSPVVMMVRLPFGVDLWELLLSMILLISGFIGSTWVAGKIYRTGVLMYGKKVNYKELWKWLRYKN